MMLYPSVSQLLEKVETRYLLVNVIAKRAREIADSAEERNEKLTEKSVKLAVNEIYNGDTHYYSGKI